MNLLPGWEPDFGGGVQALDTIEFVASSISIGTSITAPMDIQAGDSLLIWQCAVNDDFYDPPPSLVTPSGFSLIGTDTATFTKAASWRCALHWKLAAGTEGGQSFNVMNGQDGYITPNQRSIMAVFRKTPASVGMAPQDIRVDASTSGVSQTTINMATGQAPLIGIDCYMGFDEDIASVFPGAICNPASGAADLPLALRYFLYDAAPEDQLTGSNWGSQASCYFELT